MKGLARLGLYRRSIGLEQLKYIIPIALLAPIILNTPLASCAPSAQQYDMTVPLQYQAGYATLSGILKSFNTTLGLTFGSTKGLTFATELLPANGNRGQALLQPKNLASVAVNLNALQAMGVQGVTIAVGYPLLDPTFPNSAQYLSYFAEVVSMAHARGMKVLIESQILFANTPYSPLTFDWSALPYSQYVTNHIAQDQLIINQIHPDYLELGVEADTEAYLSGYHQLNTPTGWSSYIEQLLAGLNNGNRSTKLVAGVATWLDPSYVSGFANDPRLDFLSTHVYPIYGSNLQNLLALRKIAQQNGKRLVIDEVWLQKILQPQGHGQGIGGPAYTPQDVFAFSAPLDEQFLTLLTKFSQIYPVEYLSPFNEWYFWAYLNWTLALGGQVYFPLEQQIYTAAGQNMASNTLTPTGTAYSQLAHDATLPVAEFRNGFLALLTPILAAAFAFRLSLARRATSD